MKWRLHSRRNIVFTNFLVLLHLQTNLTLFLRSTDVFKCIHNLILWGKMSKSSSSNIHTSWYFLYASTCRYMRRGEKNVQCSLKNSYGKLQNNVVIQSYFDRQSVPKNFNFRFQFQYFPERTQNVIYVNILISKIKKKLSNS